MTGSIDIDRRRRIRILALKVGLFAAVVYFGSIVLFINR